jgi:hypothetical protein
MVPAKVCCGDPDALPLAQHPDLGVLRPCLRPNFREDSYSLLELLHGLIGLTACMIQVSQIMAQSRFAVTIPKSNAEGKRSIDQFDRLRRIRIGSMCQRKAVPTSGGLCERLQAPQVPVSGTP